MKYETHCDDSGVGMFKMASGVSFVKQFLDSPAEGAKHNDAGCSQRQIVSHIAILHTNLKVLWATYILYNKLLSHLESKPKELYKGDKLFISTQPLF